MEQSRNQRSCKRNLPEELVMEILTRLPVKSLLRFMSVRKDWKSLISSQSFRKLHGKRHNSSLPLILTLHDSNYGFEEDESVVKDYYLTTFDLYGKFIQKRTLPISSKCLVILSIPFQSKLLCFVDLSEKILFSYNPSTRQMFHLPDPPCFSLPKFRLNTPTFGYIPTKDEYMLVMIVGKNPLGKWVFEVLTFSISDDNNFRLHYNEWRSIEVSSTLNIFFICDGLFVSQVFYWGLVDENRNYHILSFDVETEVFSNFMYPEGDYHPLIGLKDELYAMDVSEDSLVLKLWKLCTDGNGNKSWTLYKTFKLCTDDPFVNSREFNWVIFVYRSEYLQCYNEPNNVLLETGRLMLEDVVLEEGKEYFMPYWDVSISTNLFTL